MIKLINNNLINLNTFINKFLKRDEPIFMLGRWCHVNLPKCNHSVIMRKIDFANSDNNLSYNKINKNNNYFDKKKQLSPQEYIDAFSN